MKLLLALFTFTLSSCYQVQSQNSQQDPEEKAAETPVLLLVVTGYSSGADNVTTDSLQGLAASGLLLFSKAASEKAPLFFKQKPVRLKEVKDFVAVSKNKLLVCTLEELDPRLKVLSIGGKNFFRRDQEYVLAKGDVLSLFAKEITQVSITGVTAITRSAGKIADAEGIGFLTAKLKDQFQYTDIMHMSNEVSLCDTCTYVGKTMKFCMKTAHAEALKTMGADVVELTGNHNLDYGKTWYQNSLDWYKKNGIKTVGGGASPAEAEAPLIVELKDGRKLGWMAFNETCPLGECADKTMGANRYSREKAERTVKKLREAGVSTIVCGVQFGEWDKYAPHAGQVKISKELIDMGVDFVYGTANHQIQQVEFYKGKIIFYGLGNFLFDQIHRIGVRQACFLHQFYYQGKLVSVVPVFTFMEGNRQNRLAKPDEILEMKKVIFSDSLLYK